MSNKSEKHFVLAGVCVHESRIYSITRQMDELAKKYLPDTPNALEFHASEILNKKSSPWKDMSYQVRLEALKEVLGILAQQREQTVAFACAVHKASYLNEDIALMAFEDLCSRLQMFLNRLYHNEKLKDNGQIILDKSADENQIQRLAIEFRSKGTRWGRSIRDIPEVPMFVDSKSSRLIQLADHVAYAVYKRYEQENLALFNVIQHKFDEENGVLHGLVHKHTTGETCLCPACMSRR